MIFFSTFLLAAGIGTLFGIGIFALSSNLVAASTIGGGITLLVIIVDLNLGLWTEAVVSEVKRLKDEFKKMRYNSR